MIHGYLINSNVKHKFNYHFMSLKTKIFYWQNCTIVCIITCFYDALRKKISSLFKYFFIFFKKRTLVVKVCVQIDQFLLNFDNFFSNGLK